MKQNTRIFFGLILGCSLLLNIVLLKRRVEINFLSGEGKQTGVNTKTGHANEADFYNDFENGATEGWSGSVTKEPTAAESKFSLEAEAINNPYFVCASSKNFKNRLEISGTTTVEFEYFIKDGSLLRIQMYSPSHKDNFYYDIKNPTTSQWTKVSVSLAEFKDNSHTGISPQRQDIFSNIQIYGGNAGENTKLYIDNVKIVN